MSFHKALKTSAKLRILLSGLSGAGKTYTALKLATELVKLDNKLGKIAFIDTERNASVYADLFDYDIDDVFVKHTVEEFIHKISDALKLGYKIIIIDSLSHAWKATLVLAESSSRKWLAATPAWDALIATIRNADAHIICTARQKTDYVATVNDAGKMTKFERHGTKVDLRDQTDYEFNIAGTMHERNLELYKSVIPALFGHTFHEPGQDVAEIIHAWLHDTPMKATWDKAAVIAYCKEAIDTNEPDLIELVHAAIVAGGTDTVMFKLDAKTKDELLSRLKDRLAGYKARQEETAAI